ncbi:hypothetical protein HGO38_22715 [Rhizobium sp. CG5]|uniref:hypothetical protein n=1 Tax=Rhizobium sp. CG5 TaxID=2726076 RepID=UPI0020332128|nr:hypothetical protein [Rhizobium sp. CG5]MCM2476280.1 hypothetical protein [Rhizobium sp. CG5]
MTELYCDILPRPNGWIFLLDGTQSPVYPSHRLAVEAARAKADQIRDKKGAIVLRQQDLTGRMRKLSSGHISLRTVGA